MWSIKENSLQKNKIFSVAMQYVWNITIIALQKTTKGMFFNNLLWISVFLKKFRWQFDWKLQKKIWNVLIENDMVVNQWHFFSHKTVLYILPYTRAVKFACTFLEIFLGSFGFVLYSKCCILTRKSATFEWQLPRELVRK